MKIPQLGGYCVQNRCVFSFRVKQQGRDTAISGYLSSMVSPYMLLAQILYAGRIGICFSKPSVFHYNLDVPRWTRFLLDTETCSTSGTNLGVSASLRFVLFLTIILLYIFNLPWPNHPKPRVGPSVLFSAPRVPRLMKLYFTSAATSTKIHRWDSSRMSCKNYRRYGRPLQMLGPLYPQSLERHNLRCLLNVFRGRQLLPKVQ